MHQINIDPEKCEGCENCYEACFADVIRWDDETRKPVVLYPEECAGCNWCELSCAMSAIKVVFHNPAPYPEPYPSSIYPIADIT